jgi:hypothetical protein
MAAIRLRRALSCCNCYLRAIVSIQLLVDVLGKQDCYEKSMFVLGTFLNLKSREVAQCLATDPAGVSGRITDKPQMWMWPTLTPPVCERPTSRTNGSQTQKSGSDTGSFRDDASCRSRIFWSKMPSGKCGRQSACGRCRPASAGGRVHAADAVRQVREAECIRQMPSGKCGRQSASGRCRPASAGGRVHPADAVRQMQEAESRREKE